MIYNLLLHYPEGSADDLGQEAIEGGQAAFDAYGKALDAAGVLVSAEVMHQSPATTTVRKVDGSLQVQDGPFADTKEHLGGIVVIDVPDLDAALEWAGRAPSVEWDAVEVRPVAVRFLDGAWAPAS